MTELIDSELVGEALDAYLDWRAECDAVWDACDWWAHDSATDAPTAVSDGRQAPSATQPVRFWRA